MQNLHDADDGQQLGNCRFSVGYTGRGWAVYDETGEDITQQYIPTQQEAQALADILNGDLPDPELVQDLREAMRANL